MLCTKCQTSMRIANSKFITEGTDIFNQMELVCVNPSCELGTSIDTPDATKVIIVKNKVN